MAQFIVVGLGNFGSTVCRTLVDLGHEVLAMDVDGDRVDEVKGVVEHAVVADAADKDATAHLASGDFEAAIVSLGDRMEASILATLHLKEMGVKRLIIKANSADHGKVLQAIGATEVIYPEQEVAVALANRLHAPNMIDHIPLAPEYSIVEMATPDEFVGKTLKELELRRKYGVVVIAVKNVLFDTFDLVPDADMKIKPDTVLVAIGKEADLKRIKLGERD